GWALLARRDRRQPPIHDGGRQRQPPTRDGGRQRQPPTRDGGRQRLAVLLAAGFAGSVLVNASMQDWWGAEAFGQRRLLGLTPLFALGLGEVLAALSARGRALAAAG